MSAKIQLKRGTAADLYAVNPVLLRGEPALEVDTNKIKYGDGTTPWRALPYGNASIAAVDGGELFRAGLGPDPNTFIPPNLNGLALWLDATDANYISLVSGKVSQLDDKSLDTRHFFQSLKTHRPVAANQINDLDVLTFDGSDDAMLSTFDLVPQCTVFVVLKRRGTSPAGKVFTGYRADNTEFVFCATETGTTFGVLAADQYVATQAVDNQTPVVYSVTVDATAVTTRLNGLFTQTAAYANTSAFKKFAIGSSRTDYANGAYSGDIAEIVVYSRVLPDTERQQVEGYLLNRWDIVQTVHPLLTDMAAFWPMNEASGARTDISGNNNVLTQTGTVSGTVGVLGNAAVLSGGANYLANSTLSLNTSFTVSGWFKASATTGVTAEIIQNWDGSTGQVRLGFGDENGNTNQLWAYIYTNAGPVRLSYDNLAAGEWHHFVLILDPAKGEARLYVNNVLEDEASVASAVFATTHPLQIGIGDLGNQQNTVAFLLDSVGIWTRALSRTDVAMLWNGGFGKEDFTADTYGDNVALLLHMNKLPNTQLSLDITGPRAYWKFDETSGSFIDAAGGGEMTETGGTIERSAGVAHIADGDNAWLTLPAGVCDIGSQPKTFSVWFKIPQVATNYQWMLVEGGPAYDGHSPFYLENTGFLNCIFTTQQGTWTNYVPYTSTSPTANVWHHAVAVFNGTQCSIYYDGQLVTQSAYTGAVRVTGVPHTLGQYNAINPSSLINNATSTNIYIAELGIWDAALSSDEVTKLFNAGFDTTYIPPPYVPAPSFSTPLLMHFDGPDGSTTFTDSSSNNLAIATTGNPVISTSQSKFAGAGAFDGASFLSTPETPVLDISTGDFTIEAWVFLNSMPTTDDLIDWSGWMIIYERGSPNAADGWQFQIGQTNLMFSNGYGEEVCSGAHGMVPNQWYHVSVTRSGTTFRVFVNGVQVGISTNELTLYAGSTYYIGCETGQGAYLNGYIDDLRVIKGAAAYTENFTPPTAPLTTFSPPTNQAGTVLLLNFDGTDGSTTFTDSGRNNLTVTPTGNPTISTAQSKFGGASGYFDGNFSYVTVPGSNNFDLAVGDFTIEGWLYPTSNWYNGIIGSRNNGGLHGWCLYVAPDGRLYTGSVRGNAGYADTQLHPTPIATNTWTHFAVVKTSAGYTAYINGVAGPVLAAGGFQYLPNLPIAVGALASFGEYPFSGYLDDIRVTKGLALYTADFTPPAAALSAILLPETALLLHFDGTNGSTTFRDVSGNNLSVTANGDAAIGTAAKFGSGAASFDGDGDWLGLSGSGLADFTDQDFTIEMWVYRNGSQSDFAGILSFNTDGGNGLYFGVGTGNQLRVVWSNAVQVLAADPIPDSTWSHIAIVRSGGTVTVYQDGVSVGTAEISGSLPYQTADVAIGRLLTDTSDYYWNGYIDELRITKNAAVYTADFTPPTAPFPPADPPMPPSTSITYFYDHSKYHHDVTPVGDAQIKTNQVKFGNGAGKFDGAGDYLTVSNTAFNFGEEDFTIEWWQYVDATSLSPGNGNQQGIFGNGRQEGVPEGFNCYIHTVDADLNKIYVDAKIGGIWRSPFLVSTVSFTGDIWQHCAVVRRGSEYALYVNGELQDSATVSGPLDYPASAPASLMSTAGNIGEFVSSAAGVYLDDFRVTKGVARYASNFTPPTKEFPDPIIVDASNADPYAEHVVLLLHMDGSDGSTVFTDNSYLQNIVTPTASAAISTTQSKFGGAAGAFNLVAPGDYLTISDSEHFNLSNVDWTIEAWVYPTTYANYNTFIAKRKWNDGPTAWELYLDRTTGYLGFYTGTTYASQTAVPLNQWTHTAASLANGVLRLFVNGVKVSEFGNVTVPDISEPIRIGYHFSSIPEPFTGYIDDLRVTKGVARYTANFTPPTAAFPNPFTPATGASLLLHFDGSNSSTTFTDSSANALTVTASGNAVISTAQSKFGGASGYFDGGSRVLVEHPDLFNFGDEPFTIEFWVWLDPNRSYEAAIVTTATAANGYGTDSEGVWIGVRGSGLYYLVGGNVNWIFLRSVNGGDIDPVGGTLNDNQWYHIAVVRDGATFKLFKDGVLIDSVTPPSATLTNVNNTIAVGGRPVWNQFFTGYVDEVRVVKGTALYTTDFTPPTAPFPPGGFRPTDVTGNDLWLDADSPLTVFNNNVLSWGDLSDNNRPATTADYSPPPVLSLAATPTGLRAAYFGGNPNVLKVAAAFKLKNSSGFVVCGMDPQDICGTPRAGRLLSFQPVAGLDWQQPDGLVLHQEIAQPGTGNNYFSLFNQGNSAAIQQPCPIPWRLVSYTIDSNGNAVLRTANTAVSTQFPDLAATSGPELLLGLGGGFFAGESLQGYIAAVVHYDHKLGPAALAAVEKYLYTKYLAVPPSGSTSLLLHFDGADGSTTFTDSSSYAATGTANNNAAISTTQSKFGGASGYFNAPADRVAFPHNDAYRLGSDDFTIEAWIYPTGFDATFGGNHIVSKVAGLSDNDNRSYGFGLALDPYDTQCGLTFYGHTAQTMGGGGVGYTTTTRTIPLNAWTHVAVSRVGNTLRFFINGVRVSGTDITATLNGTPINSAVFDHVLTANTSPLYVGTFGTYGVEGYPGLSYQGYIDELRITKGAAVYTENFTPPSSPFGPAASLLLHFDGADGSTTFTDSSPNALTVTANGNAQISTAQSKFGGASGYFDAVDGSYLSLQQGVVLGLDDFTIEFWCYPSTGDSSYTYYKRLVATGANTNFLIQKWDSGSNTTFGTLNIGLAGNNYLAEGTSIFYDQWNHIAVTRQSGVVRGYVNGILGITISDATSYEITDAVQYVGQDIGQYNEPFGGYIDELRIVKGTAIYTANFTPPAAPF